MTRAELAVWGAVLGPFLVLIIPAWREARKMRAQRLAQQREIDRLLGRRS